MRNIPDEMIPVGQLEVLAYTSIQCPNNIHLWNLSRVPVRECAYYLSALHQDREIYDAYIDLWAIRYRNEKGETAYSECRAKRTFDNEIKKLADEIGAFGGYDLNKDPIFAWGKLIKDGHHRAAIICAICGPDREVPVRQQPQSTCPKDIEECAGECKPT